MTEATIEAEPELVEKRLEPLVTETKLENSVANFFKSLSSPNVQIQIALPLYPETEKAPLTFFLDLDQGEDFEKENSAFLALSDEERKDARFNHNVEIIATLSREIPLNLPGFAPVNSDRVASGDYEELRAAVRQWFNLGSPATNKRMGHIARLIIGRYYYLINPREYL